MEKSVLMKELRGVGLPEKAALIYAHLLEVGAGFPSNIASATKLNRSTTYHTLAELSARGLVSQIEHGKKIYYQIEKPTRLVGFVKDQIGLAEERLERVTHLLPDIEGLFALTPHKPRVRYFEGLQGVLAVYADHIAQMESYEMLGYSNVEKLMGLLPKKFVEEYLRKKQRAKITTRAIFPDVKFAREYNRSVYMRVAKPFLVEARYIPAKDFPYEAELTLYGKNKISIINFQQRTLIGVIIEDETMAGMLRMIFELAWKGAV